MDNMQCWRCDETKPREDFRSDFRHSLTRRRGLCLTCHATYCRARYWKGAERRRARRVTKQQLLRERIGKDMHCYECDEMKPREDFRADCRRQLTWKVGLCKACAGAMGREWYRKNRERSLATKAIRQRQLGERSAEEMAQDQAQAYPTGEKLCSGCKKNLSLTAFTADRFKRGTMRARCRACEAVRARKWRWDNNDWITDARRRWAEANREKANALVQRHHAFRLSINFAELVANFDGFCAYCLEEKGVEVDHMIPVSRGGEDCRTNAAPACRSCNARKHAMTPLEYICKLADEGALGRLVA